MGRCCALNAHRKLYTLRCHACGCGCWGGRGEGWKQSSHVTGHRSRWQVCVCVWWWWGGVAHSVYSDSPYMCSEIPRTAELAVHCRQRQQYSALIKYYYILFICISMYGSICSPYTHMRLQAAAAASRPMCFPRSHPRVSTSCASWRPHQA